MRQDLAETQRDYTGKEEWLRESMAARRQLERLSEGLTRLETRMEFSGSEEKSGSRDPEEVTHG